MRMGEENQNIYCVFEIPNERGQTNVAFIVLSWTGPKNIAFFQFRECGQKNDTFIVVSSAWTTKTLRSLWFCGRRPQNITFTVVS